MNWPASAITRWWRSHANLRIVGVLLLGQLVSSVSALNSLTASLLAELGVDAPLTQTWFTYASLALVYGSILLYRHQKPLVSWYWYLLLALADVHGNYLIIKAYQYTSITSVTLLGVWTIPWVIIFTWFFLGTRYSLWQLSGAAVCVAGLGVVLLSDTGSSGGGSKPMLGDVLVIVGTLFYGTSNVGVEFCAKRRDRTEVLCMLGVFGLLITTVEASIIELKTLESVEWSVNIVLSFIGFAVTGFMFYTIEPFVLKLGGAAIFNLSTLTSNMWAVVFEVFIYHKEVSWLYFLSFAIIVVGLIIYSTTYTISHFMQRHAQPYASGDPVRGKDSVPASATENENQNTEYQMLNDESTASGNVSSAS